MAKFLLLSCSDPYGEVDDPVVGKRVVKFPLGLADGVREGGDDSISLPGFRSREY